MDETLYLHCNDCGEAFDTLRTAFDHKCTEVHIEDIDFPTFYISTDL